MNNVTASVYKYFLEVLFLVIDLLPAAMILFLHAFRCVLMWDSSIGHIFIFMYLNDTFRKSALDVPVHLKFNMADTAK